MNSLRPVLLFFAVLIFSFFAIGMLLPKHWQVQRSIVIAAPAEKIYPYLANFKEGWSQWSVFDFQDPKVRYSYAGPEQGEGATRRWISEKMGNGFQKITKASPKEGVNFELVMEANHFALRGHFEFKPLSQGTEVVWTDEGENENIFFRYMSVFMDRMMGETFEQSLNTLKQKVEAK